MCNLYSITRAQDAIRQLFRIRHDRTGNLPPLPGIFPDQMAPIVRNHDGERELLMMRWGFPSPPNVNGPVVTNVRNVKSSYWRPWLKSEFRCLVHLTSFCGYEDTKPRKTTIWFALSEDRPLAAFAGIWRPWTETRGTKAEPIEGGHLLYSLLTCEPNTVVKPIHPTTMPVILTTDDEFDIWLNAPAEEALTLQRPFLLDGALQIVARGERKDAT